MKWITVETHTHTVHSDGSLTVKELLEVARRAELDVIVITDHNTDSALEEVSKEQSNPRVISGIEWTTFYGHVVVIAPEQFVEWRDMTAENLWTHLDQLHRAGGVAVMAHPCDPGEPFCCGCHWDFAPPCWEKLDAMEVWHESDPSLSRWNARAKTMWLEQLAKGRRITALCAADWHETIPPQIPFGVNYMGTEEALPLNDAVKDAIRRGRVYSTLGPTVEMTLSTPGSEAEIGGEAAAGEAEASLVFHGDQRRRVWEPYELEPAWVALINGAEEISLPFPGYGKKLCLPLRLRPGAFRVELRGTVHHKEAALLMTNPVFITASV